MVPFHGINDNITIPHPSYLVVYQDEAKNISQQRDKEVFGSEPSKKNPTKQVVHVSPLSLFKKRIPLHFWKGAGCSEIIKKIKYLWTNVHHKMVAFTSNLWRIVVLSCTVTSVTSQVSITDVCTNMRTYVCMVMWKLLSSYWCAYYYMQYIKCILTRVRLLMR